MESQDIQRDLLFMMTANQAVLKALLTRVSQHQGQEELEALYDETCKTIESMRSKIDTGPVYRDADALFQGLLPDEKLTNLRK